ncbi:MAG: hypothetical protein V4773_11640 [Verrucomicrobiota bacterium]
MPPLLHTLRLQSAPTQRDSETVHIVTSHEAAGAAPLFRAPTFPTPHQFSSELPFTVNLRYHVRSRP